MPNSIGKNLLICAKLLRSIASNEGLILMCVLSHCWVTLAFKELFLLLPWVQHYKLHVIGNPLGRNLYGIIVLLKSGENVNINFYFDCVYVLFCCTIAYSCHKRFYSQAHPLRRGGIAPKTWTDRQLFTWLFTGRSD